MTGTPPRLEKGSIDFAKCSAYLPDDFSIPFSFMNDTVWLPPDKQVPTYLTYTNKDVARIVRDNMHCNLHVTEEITGPRYCPSIESKILRFSTSEHQIWLEPEGLDSPVIYPSGLSCTLPEEKQVELVRCIPGLENARFGNSLRLVISLEKDFSLLPMCDCLQSGPVTASSTITWIPGS